MAAQEDWKLHPGVLKMAKSRPALGDLLLQRPQEIVNNLGCSADQKRRCFKLLGGVASIVKQVLPVTDVYYAGSFGRLTALNYNFDADVVFTIENFDHRRRQEYHEICQDALYDEFYRGISVMDTTPFCTTVVIAKFVKADLLITGDPQSNRIRNPPRFYSAAASVDVDKEILEFGNEEPLFRPYVLLCKHWRNLDERAGGIKSFHIELLCKGMLEDNPRLSIPSLFREFLRSLADGDTAVWNPNPYNNRYIELSSMALMHVRPHALETLKTFHRYIRPGNNTRCPCCGVQRFLDPTGVVQHVESGSCSACRGSQNARTLLYNFVRDNDASRGYLNPMLMDSQGSSLDSDAHLYSCPRCDRTFRQLSSLMSHMSAKHPYDARLALSF
eukprot:gnl/TRDRNA2_/TRDRNA2_186432_c0_seq1.p1 gnl/TRDRNA2_/TRDRNA2_186432_c0~~gnl/TRDRNA2_/TRDRNA2_186432_c0_seq1.p1  ORF type:complete len:387 (+),score=47.72 gnl/TRDRNA2_/TRDRNA2_186432_c0_seq1:94-1254(+)